MSYGHATVTVFTKLGSPNDPHGALLSKRISLGPDGHPASDLSACKMWNGIALTAPAPDAAALAWLINGMGPANALALGSLNGSTALGTTVRVVTTKALQS